MDFICRFTRKGAVIPLFYPSRWRIRESVNSLLMVSFSGDVPYLKEGSPRVSLRKRISGLIFPGRDREQTGSLRRGVEMVYGVKLTEVAVV